MNPSPPSKPGDTDKPRPLPVAMISFFNTDAKRLAIADAVVAGVRERYAAFSNAVQIVDVGTPGSYPPNAITVDFPYIFRGLIGSSRPSKSDDGVDRDADIASVVQNQNQYSPAVQAFLLSRALNQSTSTHVAVYSYDLLEKIVTVLISSEV